MKITEFKQRKKSKKKISMITCYDYTFARIIDSSNIDTILIGDSGTMVMHGNPSTVHATVDEITLMIKGVATGIQSEKLIIGDMPFLSYRRGIKYAMRTVNKFIKAGANAVKLEGVTGNKKVIKHIIGSGVPVIGHIGLTPQSINSLGNYCIQGKGKEDAAKLLGEANQIAEMGCIALVLECIPSDLAKEITETIDIPTIGIGAGRFTDGQVLVLQDMLGMYKDISPKFVRQYLKGFELMSNALNNFHNDVQSLDFPNKQESF